MFFPISDDNPSSSVPYLTYLLIGICTFVFVLQYLSQMNPLIYYNFGFIPANFFSDYSSFTIYTSMFLHGGFFHIAGNMLYLWIFGDNVEDSMGTLKFIIFYLLCGTIAAICQGLVDPSSEVPMVGASGAIAGVLGAYLMLYPKANVKCLVFIIIIIQAQCRCRRNLGNTCYLNSVLQCLKYNPAFYETVYVVTYNFSNGK